ncbi:hypothetical protein KXW47_007501, partial [Aspergillus fumigatus]
MLSLKIELRESYASADDNPDEVVFLRLLSRHPKIKACLGLILSVLSSLTPAEALLLLQEVHNDSEVLDTFQVWNESLLQASDPTRDEPLPTWETDGLSPPWDEFIDIPHDDEYYYIHPASFIDNDHRSIPAALFGPSKLDKELIEWVLQRDPHTVSYDDKRSQTPVKEETFEGEPLKCDMQDQSPPEITDTTTRKRSCSASSSSTNDVGISLKGASALSKVEKKIPKKSRAVLKASKKANLRSTGSRTSSNDEEIMLDLNLPTSATGAVTPMFVYGVEEEAVTLIQLLYKTTVGESLDAAHAQTVKTAASSPICIGVAEFAK